MFQELCVHQLPTILALNQHDILDNILVGEESENRPLLLKIPQDDTLVIGAGGESFLIH